MAAGVKVTVWPPQGSPLDAINGRFAATATAKCDYIWPEWEIQLKTIFLRFNLEDY